MDLGARAIEGGYKMRNAFQGFVFYAVVLSLLFAGCSDDSTTETNTTPLNDSVQAVNPVDGQSQSADSSREGSENGDAPGTTQADIKQEDKTPSAGPLYYIAVHCDPNAVFPEEYLRLEEMIAEADAHGIKLTLMFTPQWAEFIVPDATRKSKIAVWEGKGHEIAMHHHSVYHPGTWDQYTDFAFEEYAPILGIAKAQQMEKLGDLDALMKVLDGIKPGMVAGCANAETDKRALPDTIIKDTCPGFYTNYAYPIGTRGEGADPLMGANDFVLVGTTTNGIERRWLNHGLISANFVDGAEEALRGLAATGAHGSIIHTKDHDLSALKEWLKRLIEFDKGAGSSTLSAIIEGGTLPEETIDSETLNRVYDDEENDKGEGPPGGADKPADKDDKPGGGPPGAH